jgi:putative tryptophan/tyrosine transport system substrate-binding protein
VLCRAHSSRGFFVNSRAITYKSSLPDLFRRAASYVDKILKGANPAEMPIQLPTKFELAINLNDSQGARAYNSTIATHPGR